MAQRDDYILRFIDLLGKALAEALHLRRQGKHDQALIAVVTAQEKLFARPTPEYANLSLDEQLRLLTVGESAASARTKCLGYASLLREAGLIYEARGQPGLAVSAFQLALQVTLTVAVNAGTTEDETAASIQDLLPRIPAEQLYPPVKELLEKHAEL